MGGIEFSWEKKKVRFDSQPKCIKDREVCIGDPLPTKYLLHL